MKKNFLLSIGLLSTLFVGAQSQKMQPSSINLLNKKEVRLYNPQELATAFNNQNSLSPIPYKVSSASPYSWIPFANSINVYGLLVSNSKIISYNEDLNVVAFIHRKFCTYTITNSAEDNSGVMVARIIRNWDAASSTGTANILFDSTAFASSSSDFPRYPNGGIYNPPGNTNISNAYIVGCGPTTDGNGWTGNWYSSKQLGTINYNNTPSNAPNAQQWFSNTGGVLKGHNFNRNNFCVTDDGKVRSVCTVGTADNDGTGGPAPGDTSLYITTGTFAGGTFSWTGTELFPDFKIAPGDGTTNIGDVLMAWNEAGTVGYAIAIGQNKTTTVSVNQGLQPRVYKTTNSGASWAIVPDMNFAAAPLSTVVADLPSGLSVNTTVAVPWFRSGEGMDAIVDKDDRLHFVTTLVPHTSVHPDSVSYIFSYTNGGDSYFWPHTPGFRPYIYDFTTTGSGWAVRKIDSLSTEAPRGSPADQLTGNGYNENPWLPSSAPVSKPVSSARIQLGRTPNGSHIYYTWTESDTLVTNGNKKWNTFPNIKLRVLDVATNFLTPEYNTTNPSGVSPTLLNARNRAFFHYTSAKSAPIQTGSGNTFTITIPMSVSNNLSLNGDGDCSSQAAVTHFFNAVTYAFNQNVGIVNQSLKEKMKFNLAPNPASGSTNLVFNSGSEEAYQINVTDVTGKQLLLVNGKTVSGENNVKLNITGLQAGIYFITLFTGNQITTNKLVLE